MKKILFIGMVLIFAISACKKENEEENVNNIITSHSDCKNFSEALKNSLANDESCIEYSYNAETRVLSITHVNSAFNCCPGDLSSTYDIEDQHIIIRENESEAMCGCMCLFDLHMEMDNVTAGVYFFRLIEAYGPYESPLEFQLNLSETTSGTYCVNRNGYPWGIPE